MSADSIDPLRCDSWLSDSKTLVPIVIIGLPRSGSTYLTHLLSHMDNLFVFDDLYCLQKAQALGCKGTLTTVQIEGLVDFLGWSTRARIKHETDFTPFPMTWEDVDILCATLLSLFKGSKVTWPEVMNEYLTRLALVHGKTRWGYKTPQDFHHIRLIKNLFNNVRFVFLMRDPRNVMASYKFNRTKDGVPGQYHPLVYALYWKMAIKQAMNTCSNLDIPLLVLRFEDLVGDQQATILRLEEFVQSRLKEPVVIRKTNTSFGSFGRKKITDTEVWMCEKICGGVMETHNYILSHVHPRLHDFADLMATTVRFTVEQTRRCATSRVARVKVGAFCRRLVFGRRS